MTPRYLVAGRLTVALVPVWRLRFASGFVWTWLSVGPVIVSWLNRQPPRLQEQAERERSWHENGGSR